jgi:arabinoxylan arabinofuranohydrolase
MNAPKLPGSTALLAIFCVSLTLTLQTLNAQKMAKQNPRNTKNPIIPGYYADASIVQLPNETFIYATEDPWGGETLGCWRSTDFANWRSCALNWPTKTAAASPTANSNKVWAPSVIHAKNGHFYMYVSIGSEVWVGTADTPTGPWKNALGSKPLIAATFNRKYNMIDAEVFQDTDGSAYLYWGSGLHWVNGHCFAVKLKPDMVTFDGEPKDVTPPNYFEGPFMYKHAGRYYLMYSQGKATDKTYNVRYSIGDTPFGPFHEGKNSPILVTDESRNILGPGHHAIFDHGGKTYILYHRHSVPFSETVVRRQLCIDELRFSADGEIEKVAPSNEGPALLSQHNRTAGSMPAIATASSSLSEAYNADGASDDNYATRWAPALADAAPWIQLDLGQIEHPNSLQIRFEYPEKTYRFSVQSSNDGKNWKDVYGKLQTASGSPITLQGLPQCQYIRLVFPRNTEQQTSIFELTVLR